jgi:hypothetical protein
MRKGSVLFHPSFEFTNGEIGRKYLVILNTPDIKNQDHSYSAKQQANHKINREHQDVTLKRICIA